MKRANWRPGKRPRRTATGCWKPRRAVRGINRCAGSIANREERFERLDYHRGRPQRNTLLLPIGVLMATRHGPAGLFFDVATPWDASVNGHVNPKNRPLGEDRPKVCPAITSKRSMPALQ